jgi:hypothetical protein
MTDLFPRVASCLCIHACILHVMQVIKSIYWYGIVLCSSHWEIASIAMEPTYRVLTVSSHRDFYRFFSFPLFAINQRTARELVAWNVSLLKVSRLRYKDFAALELSVRLENKVICCVGRGLFVMLGILSIFVGHRHYTSVWVKELKFLLCTTPHREDVWGSGCIAPRILNLGTGRRWVVSFTPWPLQPRYSLDRRLGGPQSCPDTRVHLNSLSEGEVVPGA